ncbi:hypothetical protein ACGCUQ_03390 [Eubacteriales bacterium KG127]
MSNYGDNFRAYLNKVVFVKSVHGIETLAAIDTDNINGFFAYVFWRKDGKVSLRVLDIGYGLEDYFEVYGVDYSFLENPLEMSIVDFIESILYVFDAGVVTESEEYSKIVAETELSNLVSEELINSREISDMDDFRQRENQDIVSVVFFSHALPFKSKAKVHCLGYSKGYNEGTLLETPFGWKGFKKGDKVRFRVDKLGQDKVLLASV